jgi:hypothetical protein
MGTIATQSEDSADQWLQWLIYRTNGSTVKPMAPTCAESSDPAPCRLALQRLSTDTLGD